MRVVITGANGYIGRHVVKALLHRDVDVLAWDRQVDNVPTGAQILQGDILEASELPKGDVLLHLAWQDNFRHNSPSHALQLSRHFDFIRRMVLGGVSQVAVAGTVHEVGYHEGMVTESTPCHPSTLYAIAKDTLRRLIETWLESEQPKCVFQWLRMFYLYGDDGANHSVFTHLLKAAREQKHEFPFVSGTREFDFLEINECANMIAATVCQRDVTGVIHCCSGHPQRLLDRARAFIQENGLNIHLQVGAYPDRPYDSPCIYGDATKIRAILGREEHL